MKKTNLASLFLVLSLAFVGLSSVNLAESAVTNSYAWTTMQADAQRTGFSESPSPNTNQTFWKFQTEGPITSSPVVAAGMVFVGSGDGYLYAVNATTGTKMWASWVGTPAGSPTLNDNKVFIASSGTVFAFDMATGASEWNQSLREETSAGAPLVVDSRVFVSGNSTVFAFNEAFGVRLYEESIPHVDGITRLIYTDGLVVATAFRNGTDAGIGLNGFEARNAYGRFWVYLEPSGKDRYSSFIEDEAAKIFAVVTGSGGNSSVFGVTRMGMTLWEHQINGVSDAFPATAYGKVYVLTSKFVYALNVTDGSVQWSRPTNGADSVSSPVVADGRVYFGLDDGYICALDAFNGDLVWSYKTNGPVQSSPAISDGLLFVGSNDGILYAIGYPTIQSFNAGTWSDTTYEVSIQNNAIVTDFAFNQPLKQVSFNITPGSGATGFCNVTFPSNLLKGSYSVTANENQPLPFEEQTNESHTSVYFNFSSDVNIVRIEGAEAIPEFPSGITLLVAPAMFAVIAAFLYKQSVHKKRRPKVDQ